MEGTTVRGGLPLLGYLALNFLLRLVVSYRGGRRLPRAGRALRPVGRVTQITVYPVKSTRGLDVHTALCTGSGVRLPDTATADVRDRYWTVTTAEYKFLSMRQHPRIALITPRVVDDCLKLTAPSMEPVNVPLHIPDPTVNVHVRVYGEPIPGVDCGQQVAEWLQRHLAAPGVRLVHAVPNQKTGVWSKDADKRSDQVAFCNSDAVMLMSEASLGDLNQRLEDPLPALTFRANIVVSGCQPYEEENWTGELQIGQVGFSFVKLCARCTATTVDLKRGVMRESGEPLRTLRSYRPLISNYQYRPTMGVKYSVDHPGSISVGDTVYVTDGTS